MDKIITRPFKAADATAVVTDTRELEFAGVNEHYGPGLTATLNGKIVGCAGIRTVGTGEIWASFLPEFLERKRELMRISRDAIRGFIGQSDMWQIIALPKTYSQLEINFLEHLGFKKEDIWIRG